MGSLRRLHDAADGDAHLFPAAIFPVELLPPFLGKVIVFRFSVVFGDAPFGFDPTLTLKSVKRRIQRPLPHREHFPRPILDALADAKAVRRFTAEDFENQHIQRSLQEVRLLHSIGVLASSVDGSLPGLLSNVNGAFTGPVPCVTLFNR